MGSAGTWLYRNRDPVSFGVAVAVSLAATLPRFHLATPTPLTQPRVEITAFLEETRPSPADPPPPPPPPQPQPHPRPTPHPSRPSPAPRAKERKPPEAQATPVPQPTAPQAAPVTPLSGPPVAPAQAAERPLIPAPAPTPTHGDEGRAVARMAVRYEQEVLAYLERAKRYPTSREARLTRPEGTVRLWLEIGRGGQVLDAGLLASSGSNLLDAEALSLARGGQFPPFPDQAYPGQASHRFVVSLKYEISSRRSD